MSGTQESPSALGGGGTLVKPSGGAGELRGAGGAGDEEQGDGVRGADGRLGRRLGRVNGMGWGCECE